MGTASERRRSSRFFSDSLAAPVQQFRRVSLRTRKRPRTMTRNIGREQWWISLWISSLATFEYIYFCNIILAVFPRGGGGVPYLQRKFRVSAEPPSQGPPPSEGSQAPGAHAPKGLNCVVYFYLFAICRARAACQLTFETDGGVSPKLVSILLRLL
jgi:hypothetical protein